MDEASACACAWQIDSKPEALDEIDRRMMQLKIEREALKQAKPTRPRKTGLDALEGELGDLEAKSADADRPAGGKKRSPSPTSSR